MKLGLMSENDLKETGTWVQNLGNGWFGEKPQSLRKLQLMLENFPLDIRLKNIFRQKPARMISYLNHKPIYESNDVFRFTGSFANASFNFSIDTKDSQLIKDLSLLIARNLRKFRNKEVLEPSPESLKLLFDREIEGGIQID